MILDGRRPALVTEDDLDRLIRDQALEGRDIEYKLKPPSFDTEKREFQKDVTALANTDGGYIVFGLREERGIPVSLEGLP